MNGKREKEKPNEGREADGRLPDAFVATDLVHNGNVAPALALLERHGRSAAAYVRAAEEARRKSWRVFLAGGSGIALAREIQDWRHRLGETQARKAKAQRLYPERVPGVEAEIRAIEGDLERRSAILAAVPEADRVDYRARMDAARAGLETAAAQVERFRQARFPIPPELEDRLLQAEDAALEAVDVFDGRRQKLAEAGEAMQKALQHACTVLADAVGALVAEQAAEVKKIIATDARRFAAFPGRIPDAAISHYRIAETGAAIEDGLTGAHGFGMSEFWRALGAEETKILQARIYPLSNRPGLAAEAVAAMT